ncbi:hypothetical protein [Natrarchaeobius chitinivorans]|uniref:Uncharacterized protein n=1 Tax=Natrarchaeobius chitinivorans TaxID=1679083 RepID=A0A3N6LN94_NATCH|nr:hypothetical protein [Natrarchaeobius chitinivorans]RQG90758.1 hypothetical protein EA473_20115 [Natrarchaeobius chitinivorans]
MDDVDAEKIKTYEQYSRGEITETEVRALLGNEIVDSMEADMEAFEAAMKRDTSVFISSDST